MQELEVNAIATITIGAFVDKGDGVTPEEGITLAAADSAEVMKHNGTTFVDIAGAGGNQATLTHKEKGMYTLAIPAAVISDEGRLTVFISDESVCLPVWKDFMVVSQAYWASKYDAKDSGYMDVDIKAVGGTATPHTSGKLHILQGDGGAITAVGPTKTEMDNGHAAIVADTEDLQTILGTPANFMADLSTLETRLSAVRAGYLDQLDFALQEAIAAVKAETALIVGDTNELQGLISASKLPAQVKGIDNIDFGATMKTSLETAVDAGLDNAIGADPTAHSVAQRIKALDLLAEANGDGDLAAILTDVTGLNGMTPPTAVQIQTEMEEDGASLLDTIRDELANETDGLSALKALIDALSTIASDALVAIGHIAVTGSALNLVADGETLTTGNEVGDYTNTYFHDESYHVITAVGNTIDVEYLFTLPTAHGTPSSVEVIGYLREGVPAGGDTISQQIWNYVTPGWDTIDPECFTGITTAGPDTTEIHNLLAAHVGTAGGDIGKMRIRFYSNALEDGTTWNVDKILVSYAESISADLASILGDTGELQTNQGAWATATGFATAAVWTSGLATALGNYTAVRAGYLDELAAANLPTDIAAIPTVMRGTDSAALASSWTAALATILANFSAGRIGYLDNLSAGAVGLEATLTTMKQVTAGGFDRDTDSLQAIRDRGDSAWITATGGDATQAKQDIIDANIDKIITAMELDGDVYRFTENALEEAPSGTGASAASIADAVWDELLADHDAEGSAGEALADATEITLEED